MKMSRKQLQAMGWNDPSPPKKADKRRKQDAKAAVSSSEALFLAACEAHGLPTPEPEYVFAPPRKWRFDWLFAGWLALEIEGGVWTNGAHVRGEHFLSDIEKYNEAVILGFSVIRCTPDDVNTGAAFELLKRALQLCEDSP